MRYLIIMLAMGASGAFPPIDALVAESRVTGAGAQTCVSFVRRAGPEGLSDPAALQWVLGYLTGHVAASDKPHRPFTGPEGIALELLAYCRAHPQSQLAGAAASFFERNRRCGGVRGCR